MNRHVHKTNGRTRTKSVRVYPFPSLVLTEQGYTKHYYAGSDRVCARLGSGGLDHDTACIFRNEEVSTRIDSLFWHGLRLVDAKEFKPESLKELQLVDIHGKELDWLEKVDIKKLLLRLRISVKPDPWNIHHVIDNLVRERPDDEPGVYFYHSDHLGGASWITDGSGIPVQYLQYLPFGEPFVDQHPAGYQERFRFTGKEKDEETGYGYFGARYMDHELMTMWLSVDRYASKYPFISPYAYCAWNPIRLTDPTGDTIFNAHEQYRDISQNLQKLNELLKNATRGNKKGIRKKIKELKDNHEKYKKVQGALDAFKKANPEEYTRLDNLEYNGERVNITIEASDEPTSRYNAAGTTHPHFLHNIDTDEIIGVNSISITLFKHAFLGGYCGLSTLANEFGDAIFAVSRPQDQIKGARELEEQRRKGNPDYYYSLPSTKFSFDYEKYILNPHKFPKPTPYEY